MGFQPATPIQITTPDLAWEGVFAANGYVGVDGLQGVMGVQHLERGLMWAQSFLSGHVQPEFQPRVTYRHSQWLQGVVDIL